MTSQVTPKKGVAYTFLTSLTSQADVKLFQDNPTLAAGDVVIVKDGTLDGNIDTLPAAVASATRVISVTLSAAEMNADNVTVLFHDAAGAEWCDLVVNVQTTARQIDDLAPTSTALTNATWTDARAAKLDNLDGTISGADDATLLAIAALNNLSSAQAQAAATAALTAYDPPTDAEMDAALLALQGADGDTLETLSDQLDAQEPADVWAYAARTLTQSAASVTAAVSGGTITIMRGDTLSASLTGLGSIAARTKLWFTVKSQYGDADAVSVVQIEEAGGLLYLNAAAGTPANGDITVDDEDDGDITITLAAASTATLTPNDGLSYDVQMLTATGVQTLTSGSCMVVADVTRAVS